jgi:hypothetical protein
VLAYAHFDSPAFPDGGAMVPALIPTEDQPQIAAINWSRPPCLLHDPQCGFQVVNAKREVQPN